MLFDDFNNVVKSWPIVDNNHETAVDNFLDDLNEITTLSIVISALCSHRTSYRSVAHELMKVQKRCCNIKCSHVMTMQFVVFLLSLFFSPDLKRRSDANLSICTLVLFLLTDVLRLFNCCGRLRWPVTSSWCCDLFLGICEIPLPEPRRYFPSCAVAKLNNPGILCVVLFPHFGFQGFLSSLFFPRNEYAYITLNLRSSKIPFGWNIGRPKVDRRYRNTAKVQRTFDCEPIPQLVMIDYHHQLGVSDSTQF